MKIIKAKKKFSNKEIKFFENIFKENQDVQTLAEMEIVEEEGDNDYIINYLFHNILFH